MRLEYTVSTTKDRMGKKGRHSHRFKDDAPKQSFKMLRDENGGYLKPPKFLPSGRLAGHPFDLFDDIATVRASSIPKDAVIAKPDLAWMQTLFHLQGGFLPPRLDLSWTDEQAATQNGWCYVMDHAFPGLAPRKRIRHRLPRNSARRRLPWSVASGTPGQKEDQARMYLSVFDHENARRFDPPELTLLKVVCNLRNYHGMTNERTVKLMQVNFNPKVEAPWSDEAISLAWELVADYTPWLGLVDVDGIARQKAAEIEDAVVDLLAYTRSGHRVTTDEFFATFKAWNLDLAIGDKKLVSSSVRKVAAIETKPYREGRCYPGFHLPSPQELMDPAHATGDDLSATKSGLITEWLRSLRRHDPFIEFNITMSIYKKWVYSAEKNNWVRQMVMRPVKPFALSVVSPLWIHAFADPNLIAHERAKVEKFVKASWRTKELFFCPTNEQEADEYFQMPDFLLRATLLGLLVYREKKSTQPIPAPNGRLEYQPAS
jgi:hypothetical protein